MDTSVMAQRSILEGEERPDVRPTMGGRSLRTNPPGLHTPAPLKTKTKNSPCTGDAPTEPEALHWFMFAQCSDMTWILEGRPTRS